MAGQRVVLFSVAHPDDDVMAAVGFIALHRDDPDLRFVLLHATDGEAGEIAPEARVTRDELGAVRRREDEAGWRVIGRTPDRHEWLGFPDGGLAALPAGILEARISRVLSEERPDVVLTFGPDGITGHPDHILVGATTTAAFLRFTREGGPGFQRLFHAAWPQSALDRLNARRVENGLEPFNPTAIYHPRGVPDEHISCTIDQRDALPLIRAAFQTHRSQWSPFWSELDSRGWGSVAGESHLVQVWPARRQGSAVLHDPLEGL
ncbi:MAG TPA: PIG-L family deacetylase [Egibacteraceae bacterium]|nr:PIG-L family deacetylase [Egibacteraceae bacterium]